MQKPMWGSFQTFLETNVIESVLQYTKANVGIISKAFRNQCD
jgi:hypothetical protein